MSKYIKLEDAIDAIEDKIAEYIPTLYGRYAEIPLELRMAIEHLPTIEVSEDFVKDTDVPISEDCISKAYLEQEIENQVMTVEKDKEYWRGWNNALDKVVELIEDAPSVLPSRAEGEWKITNTYKDHNGRVVDRVEHADCGYIWSREMGEPLHNFCSNCGAKMRRRKDEGTNL